MKVIKATSVDEALHKGIRYLVDNGSRQPSRNGDTLEGLEPVATVFENPSNYVLKEPDRKENPFLHFFEGLWVLSGRNDLSLPTFFVPRFAEYSDNDVTLNAAYGFRMRRTWEDQLEAVVEILREDPSSRQAVIQLWDPYDLTHPTKDKACNMSMVFKIRNGILGKFVDMVVYNRSNDIIWGLYGSNVVTFSMLLEYVSGMIGLPNGCYTHVSNSYHVYVNGPGGKIFARLLRKKKWNYEIYNPSSVALTPNFVLWEGGWNGLDDARLKFDADLDKFRNLPIDQPMKFTHPWWKDVVSPLHYAWLNIKENKYDEAEETISVCRDFQWKDACLRWLNRNRT